MAELFASGRIVDCIVALMFIELAMVMYLRKRGFIHIALIPLAINSAAGAALLLSLRAALRQDSWPTVALWLVAALIAHGADLWMRSRKGAGT